MSFDIFLQRFAGGHLSEGVAALADAYLAPMVKERDTSWARIGTVDGEADVYGCRTCITEAVDPSDLPVEVPAPITVVRSGQDLLDVVERG